jgi:hypothetical protein
MGHIAIISKIDNTVLAVTPVSNDKMQVEGIDSLELAKVHLIKCFSTPDFKDGLPYLKENGDKYNLSEVDFVQTSYHENIHYNFAGAGDTWDAENMAFIKPIPKEAPQLQISTPIKGKQLTSMVTQQGTWQLDNRFKWQFIESQQL